MIWFLSCSIFILKKTITTIKSKLSEIPVEFRIFRCFHLIYLPAWFFLIEILIIVKYLRLLFKPSLFYARFFPRFFLLQIYWLSRSSSSSNIHNIIKCKPLWTYWLDCLRIYLQKRLSNFESSSNPWRWFSSKSFLTFGF